MRDEVVCDGWGIEGGDLVAEALTRRPPVGPEMTAETPRAGDGKAGEAAVAGDLAAERVPDPRAGPVGIAPPVEDDRPDAPFGVWGLRSWASSDRTGAGRGSWCQDGSGVDEPSEVGGEAGSGCTVDDVVVDA